MSINRMHMLLASMLLALPAHSADKSPEYFKYTPTSPFYLGRGFIQNDLQKNFAETCITGTPEEGSPKTGNLNSNFELYLVRDYSSFVETMGFEATFSAQNPTSAFDAGLRANRRRSEEKNTVSVIVQLSAEFSPMVLKDIALKPEIAALLKAGMLEEAIDRCGARVVVAENRGARLNAVVTISDFSAKRQQEISTEMSGMYGSAVLGTKARAAFSAEYSDAVASGGTRIDIKFKSIGGAGDEAFEKFMTSAISEKPSLDAIGAALASYAKTINTKNPGILLYQVADMPGFQVAAKDPWIQEKQNALVRFADLYRLASDKRAALHDLLSGADPRRAAYSAADLARFGTLYADANKITNKVLARHGACKAASASTVSTACGIDQALIADVNAIADFPLLKPPSISVVAAVRRGNKNDDRTLGPWQFMEAYKFANLIDRITPSTGRIDHGNAPSAYRDGLFSAVRSEIGDAMRGATGILVQSEHLSSVKLVFVADSGQFREGYTEQPYFWKSLGQAELDSFEFRPSTHMSEGDDYADARRNYILWADFAFLERPGALPAGCKYAMPGSNKPQCKEYAAQYIESLALHAGMSPWISFAAVLHNWISNGKMYQGSGRLVARAADRFAGVTEVPLIGFDWDVDEALQIARVRYGVIPGSRRETWYATGLGAVSKNFPWLEFAYRATGGIDKQAETVSVFEQKKDKWGELSIKYCPSLAVVNAKSDFQAAYLKAKIASDRRTASLSYEVDPKVWASGYQPSPYEIDVKLKAVVKVREAGLAGPEFYASDLGCQP